MGVVGGSMGSFSLNGRNFSIDGDADVAQALANYENEMKANGDGTVRLIKKRKVKMLEGIPLACDDSLGDFEFLSDLNDNGDGAADGLFNIVATLPSGAIYAGRGQMIGELKRQTQENLAEISLNLNGLKKQ